MFVGPVTSGKTLSLLEHHAREPFYRLTTRVGGPQEVKSHNGKVHRVTLIKAVSEIKPAPILFVDEVQFANPNEIDFFLYQMGDSRLMLAGLDLDFRRHSFLSTGKLMCCAETIFKLTAVCAKCGNRARYSMKLGSSGEIIDEGDHYRALCSDCYD